MKNYLSQFSIVIGVIIVLTFLTGYAKPIAEAPKQYIVVITKVGAGNLNFQTEVEKKLAEGWHLEGGASTLVADDVCFIQAMSK